MTSPLQLHVTPELSEPAMILAFEGWNDAGEAGTSALQFLNEALNSVPLADLDAEDFYDFTVRRPTVAIDADGGREIEWPRNHFRYGTVNDSRELIIGIGVEPHLRWRTFCDVIVDLALDMGVRQVLLVGGYLADVVYSQPVGITGFATHAEDLVALGVGTSHYEGPVGILGVLDDRLRREGLSVLSLWAGLPHYIEAAPNPRGALALVQKVCQFLDFKVDDSPLQSEAAAFEERISKVVAADAELAEYVRRLKRREFAQ